MPALGWYWRFDFSILLLNFLGFILAGFNKVRETLRQTLDAKSKIEAELGAEKAANEDLRRELQDRSKKGSSDGFDGQEFPGLKAVHNRGMGAGTGLDLGLVSADVDSTDESPVSAAKLRTPVEFGDEAQLRRAAIAAVTRLEELEQELNNAVTEKCDLARQMVDISIASQELQKVVLETAQMTSEISLNKERRSHRGLQGTRSLTSLSKQEVHLGLTLKSGSADLDGDLSGASDGEDVSIPAAQLRSMRNELRRLLQEKSNLENELADRTRRSSDFSNELKGLQDELKAALEMKEDLDSRFSEYEMAKARLNREVGRLSKDLDEEKRNIQAVEEAVGGLYALCKEIESAAGIEAAGRSMDDEFPTNLPDAVVHLTGRVREGICALVSHLQTAPDAGSGVDGFGSEPGASQLASRFGVPSVKTWAPASPLLGNEVDSESARAGELQAQIAELQDARNQLQEALQEQSYQSNNGRPASQSSSPVISNTRPSRFGYIPNRELQRAQQISVHQDALQRQVIQKDKWHGEHELQYHGSVNYKGDDLRQLQGAMTRVEQEMETLRQRNEQLMMGTGQVVPVGRQGPEARNISAPEQLTQRVMGLQTRAQELEQDLAQGHRWQ